MSALLSNEDLNDFIKPSVACIKPADTFQKDSGSYIASGEGEEANPIEVFIDGTSKSLEPAQISLSDCLACSGCITSAEEILVAQHSHKELLNALKSNKKQFVASVSHQSRASLALAFNVAVEVIDMVLMDLFMNKFGFKYVVGTELGRLLSLRMSVKDIQDSKSSGKKNKGPLMSSICPGWVLYVEKTHPEVIPNLSIVKSPQQITGCLLKHTSALSLGVGIEEIYHVSVMPCFDKKLEAARPDSGVADVDCVITAKELIQLMVDEGISFEQCIEDFKAKFDTSNSVDSYYRNASPDLFKFGAESWYSNLGSVSGGYGENYLLYLKDENENSEIIEVKGRNEDITEYRLVKGEEILGSIAVINGFKNIQNMIRKVGELTGTKKTVRRKGAALAKRRQRAGTEGVVTKQKPADGMNCDYIEVMACPGGCINGGGQIEAPGKLASGAAKIWKERAENKYKSIQTIEDVNQADFVESLEAYVRDFCEYFTVKQSRLLNTKFAKVEKLLEETAIALTSAW